MKGNSHRVRLVPEEVDALEEQESGTLMNSNGLRENGTGAGPECELG